MRGTRGDVVVAAAVTSLAGAPPTAAPGSPDPRLGTGYPRQRPGRQRRLRDALTARFLG